MPLKIVQDGNIDKPVIVCDHCGEEIKDARSGNYQWVADGQDAKGTTVYFTHKTCCASFEQANAGMGMWGAMELDSLLAYLANNLKLDWEAAQERARILSSIGL